MLFVQCTILMVTSFIQLNGEGEKNDNTGVFFRGDTEDKESDWHGVVKEILELEYLGESLKRVMLFNCEWYDPIHPGGTCKHNHYKIIEINYTKRYEEFEPFIISQNTRQVCYLPYFGKCKSDWGVVIKCKPRGRVEVEEVSEQTYQISDQGPSKVVFETDIPSNLCFILEEVDIIEFLRQYSMS